MIRDWFGQDGPLPAVAPPSPRSQVPAEPASTRNTRPLDVLSGIPRRRSPDGASRRGCPHARLKPRDPPVRVQIAGAGAAHRPRRPTTAAHSRRTTCGSSKSGIVAPERETGDAPEAEDCGCADRAWAEHLTGTLDESGPDLVTSHITRHDRWRLKSGLRIRVSPLCSLMRIARGRAARSLRFAPASTNTASTPCWRGPSEFALAAGPRGPVPDDPHRKKERPK